ncbi:chorismate mutase [Nocardia sp. CNY236]|uniref:chorismate mutase n=1 Tax=Nocardia sp. CNY236 TaxID=1169152 RepID=UPI000415476C|nr:chorismate mutase [Nocardia sp. CNY236]
MAETDHDILAKPRAKLDELDDSILALLSARLRVCLEIADLKSQAAIAMMQPHRVDMVLGRARTAAEEYDVDAEFLVGVYERIIEATCRAEEHRMAQSTEDAE